MIGYLDIELLFMRAFGKMIFSLVLMFFLMSPKVLAGGK